MECALRARRDAYDAAVREGPNDDIGEVYTRVAEKLLTPLSLAWKNVAPHAVASTYNNYLTLQQLCQMESEPTEVKEKLEDQLASFAEEISLVNERREWLGACGFQCWHI